MAVSCWHLVSPVGCRPAQELEQQQLGAAVTAAGAAAAGELEWQQLTGVGVAAWQQGTGRGRAVALCLVEGRWLLACSSACAWVRRLGTARLGVTLMPRAPVAGGVYRSTLEGYLPQCVLKWVGPSGRACVQAGLWWKPLVCVAGSLALGLAGGPCLLTVPFAFLWGPGPLLTVLCVPVFQVLQRILYFLLRLGSVAA